MTAMPWDVATGVMPTARPFQAAGLPTDPDQVARALATWDDFIKAGQIKDKTGGQTRSSGNEHDIFNAAYWQNGGNRRPGRQDRPPARGLQPLQLAVKAHDAGIGANIADLERALGAGPRRAARSRIVMGGWMLGNLQNLIDPTVPASGAS